MNHKVHDLRCDLARGHAVGSTTVDLRRFDNPTERQRLVQNYRVPKSTPTKLHRRPDAPP